MTAPEFSRVVRTHEVGATPRPQHVEASEAERAALARRFGLLSLESLVADLSVRREAAGVRVSGRVMGKAEQACVISGEAVPAEVDEPVDLLFAEVDAGEPDEEIELSEADCDVIPYDGQAVDLGEAVAQSFSLALDPYPRTSDEVLAEARSRLTSEADVEAQAAADKAAANPFSVLKRD